MTNVLIVGAALCVSAGLLILAVPRLTASIALLPGEAALALIEANDAPTRSGSLRAFSAQEAALDILADPRPHLNEGLIALSMVEAGAAEADDQDALLKVAEFHLGRSLAMAPGQARAWMMLAATRLRLGNADGAAKALSLSFQADPHAPILATARWPLTFVLDDQLDRDTRQWAHLEFLAFFRAQPEPATRMALRLGRIDELRALAADSDVDAQRLDRILQQMQSGGA